MMDSVPSFPPTTAGSQDNRPPRPATRGRREAEIAEAIVKHYQRRDGRGPEEARAYLIDDLLVVRQKGTLSPSESCLAQSRDGWETVLALRRKLADVSHQELASEVERVVGRRVREGFTASSRSGERIDLFLLEPRR